MTKIEHDGTADYNTLPAAPQLIAERDRYKAERDELLAALRHLLANVPKAAYDCPHCNWCVGSELDLHASDCPYTLARAALAAVDGWIAWAGGECPVPAETVVHVLYRSEHMPHRLSVGPAGVLRWDHRGTGGDIIAYRVVAGASGEGETS